jgi:uncharacterized protein
MRRKAKALPEADIYQEYYACVEDMIKHDAVLSMKQYNQHRGVDCLQHCLNVSFRSYQICRRLGLDYRSAARGGLLHDFFLYDWHKENPYGGLHGFRHPKIAAMNASSHFALNRKEQDVIRKHMWPLTPALPRHAETFVVVLVDKFYCVSEALPFNSKKMQTVYHLAKA